jgi:hypothetical protein
MTAPTTVPTTRREARAHEGRRRRRGAGRRAALAVVPLALLGSGALVYQASNAAFTATTSTGANSWTAGSVAVTNSSSGGALFSPTAVKPNSSNAVSSCLRVSYTGSLASDVKFYVTGYSNPTPGANSHNLGTYLRLTIELSSTATTNAACAGFTATGTYVNSGGVAGNTLADLSASNAWGSPLETWAAAVGSVTPQTRSYKITYWLPDYNEAGITGQTANAGLDQALLNDLQGAQTAATLTWEARNT